jgi:ribosomal protein S13
LGKGEAGQSFDDHGDQSVADVSVLHYRVRRDNKCRMDASITQFGPIQSFGIRHDRAVKVRRQSGPMAEEVA